MITAGEARNLIQTARNAKAIAQKEKVEKLITDAINAGSYFISLDEHLQDEVVAWLRKLGYEVTISSQYNESYTSINWQK